jgi:hypothetical protein
MIRAYEQKDFETIKRIHQSTGLPPNCFPDARQPLFTVKVIAEECGEVVQAGFVKLTGEAYVLVDHHFSTPENRLAIMESLVIRGLHEAALAQEVTCQHCKNVIGVRPGLEDVSCWLPPGMEKSFWPRLKVLGFEKSKWQSYTALLR